MRIVKRIIVKIIEKAFNNFRYIDSKTTVGEYTFIGKYTAITKSKIGRYCSIGTNVLIGPGEHPLTNLTTSAYLYDDNAYDVLTRKSDPIIGNDVWIGSYSVILRGVKIGNGAVVAAGAVITKNVPDFAVVAGVPAKIIKYRFSPEVQKTILESNWWSLEKEKAYKFMKNFSI